MTEPMHIISLGAGVQSSTMALMAAKGEITPMPTAAIFADTQWEPDAVYRWLDWLEPQLPFPVYRVTQGNLEQHIASERPLGKFLRVDIPAFVLVDGKPGGLINRSCTRDFKIDPIRRKVRELLGIAGKRSPASVVVVQWIGISTDESSRMKPSRESWQENRWPLIEAGMSRGHCLEWMRKNGYPKPAKSSCIGCPFHSDAEWSALTESEMQRAIEVDRRLRSRPSEQYRPKGQLFLHRSCKPLGDVDFSRPQDKQIDMFENECEGMCGV